MVAAEAAAVQLVLPTSRLWIELAVAAVHVDALPWLLAWALDRGLCPHRLTAGALVIRGGLLYDARVPRDAIGAVELRGTPVPERELVHDGDTALPASRGRVDLWLDLDRQVAVRRPLGAAVVVRRLAIAVDEPDALAAALEGEPEATGFDATRVAGGLLALPDLAYGHA